MGRKSSVAFSIPWLLMLASSSPAAARPPVVEALGIRAIDSETGESIRQLREDDSREPIWSPDGSRVAFARGYENNLEIWVVDAQGRHATRLTRNHKLDEWPS